ncbi:MAG: hypothetical protein Q9184_006887 [Pyrenodesmia sp. 2 TL-2023]
MHTKPFSSFPSSSSPSLPQNAGLYGEESGPSSVPSNGPTRDPSGPSSALSNGPTRDLGGDLSGQVGRARDLREFSSGFSGRPLSKGVQRLGGRLILTGGGDGHRIKSRLTESERLLNETGKKASMKARDKKLDAATRKLIAGYLDDRLKELHPKRAVDWELPLIAGKRSWVHRWNGIYLPKEVLKEFWEENGFKNVPELELFRGKNGVRIPPRQSKRNGIQADVVASPPVVKSTEPVQSTEGATTQPEISQSGVMPDSDAVQQSLSCHDQSMVDEQDSAEMSVPMSFAEMTPTKGSTPPTEFWDLTDDINVNVEDLPAEAAAIEAVCQNPHDPVVPLIEEFQAVAADGVSISSKKSLIWPASLASLIEGQWLRDDVLTAYLGLVADQCPSVAVIETILATSAAEQQQMKGALKGPMDTLRVGSATHVGKTDAVSVENFSVTDSQLVHASNPMDVAPWDVPGIEEVAIDSQLTSDLLSMEEDSYIEALGLDVDPDLQTQSVLEVTEVSPEDTSNFAKAPSSKRKDPPDVDKDDKESTKRARLTKPKAAWYTWNYFPIRALALMRGYPDPEKLFSTSWEKKSKVIDWLDDNEHVPELEYPGPNVTKEENQTAIEDCAEVDDKYTALDVENAQAQALIRGIPDRSFGCQQYWIQHLRSDDKDRQDRHSLLLVTARFSPGGKRSRVELYRSMKEREEEYLTEIEPTFVPQTILSKLLFIRKATAEIPSFHAREEDDKESESECEDMEVNERAGVRCYPWGTPEDLFNRNLARIKNNAKVVILVQGVDGLTCIPDYWKVFADDWQHLNIQLVVVQKPQGDNRFSTWISGRDDWRWYTFDLKTLVRTINKETFGKEYLEWITEMGHDEEFRSYLSKKHQKAMKIGNRPNRRRNYTMKGRASESELKRALERGIENGIENGIEKGNSLSGS